MVSPPIPERPLIGALLLEEGLVTSSQLENALAAQDTLGGRLGSHLVRMGALDPRDLTQVLGRQLGLPTLHRIPRPTQTAVGCIPAEVAHACQAVPIALKHGQLTVAMVDPTDGAARDRLAASARRTLSLVLAPELTIQFALIRAYGRRPDREMPSGFLPLTLDIPARVGRDPNPLDLKSG